MGLTVKRPRGITQTGWFLRGARSAWFNLCFYGAQGDAWHRSAVQEISVDVKDENVRGLLMIPQTAAHPQMKQADLGSQGAGVGCWLHRDETHTSGNCAVPVREEDGP